MDPVRFKKQITLTTIYSKFAKLNEIYIILGKCNLPKEIREGIENLKTHTAIKEIELLFKIPL